MSREGIKYVLRNTEQSYMQYIMGTQITQTHRCLRGHRCRHRNKLQSVDLEKWPLAATSCRSHPVQSNPDVTRKGLALLPSD